MILSKETQERQSFNKEEAENLHIETKAIHAGTPPCPVTGAVVQPLHQVASYVFDSAEHAAGLFDLSKPGYVYSRINNPTVSALEKRLAALDGGVGATCTPSGHAAQLLAFYTLLSSGDQYIASNRLYGGSVSQIKSSFPAGFGWNGVMVQAEDIDAYKKALTEETKFIFLEVLANPSGVIVDLEAVARIAEDAGIPLIVDNTMPTPYLCKPLDFGANIVTYSTTKYISGHGTAMGGAVIDGGNFDWGKYADKYPKLTGQDTCYKDTNFFETFGNKAMFVHNHAVGLKDLGICQQPMNAWLTLTGLETLHLRMERHCENALKVAQYLEQHEAVEWVSYAALENSPYKKLQEKYMPKGASSLFSFGLKGGYDAGVYFVEHVKLAKHLANLGDTRTLVIHPASTTHSPLSEEHKIKANAGPEVIRISVGIEHIDDIIADLDQALSYKK